jgi:hypothetical protein
MISSTRTTARAPISIPDNPPTPGKNDFLTVTYSDLLSGVRGSDQVSLQASDAAHTDTVNFSSDYIDFSRTIDHGISFTFSSVTSADGGGLELPSGASFFNSFSASGVGSGFDMAIVPEPASLALAAMGVVGAAGFTLYRKKKACPTESGLLRKGRRAGAQPPSLSWVRKRPSALGHLASP